MAQKIGILRCFKPSKNPLNGRLLQAKKPVYTLKNLENIFFLMVSALSESQGSIWFYHV
jgi:hypothetical protein